MTQQLVTVVNKVNNSAIRRIKNERGDIVYVVPSYTLPDDVVMNDGLYPADVIANSYKSLEGTPAPAGHPVSADGEHVSANSEDGILFYQCGIFNKNVQRVPCETYGHRVYVEKHIHVPTAMQTDRGRAIINAIDKGQPIHTSTGLLLNKEVESGIAANGKSYSWKATEMVFDHDAILLGEEGAATPADGVGMMVNSALLNQVKFDNQEMTVNSVTLDVNQSFNDLRERLQAEAQKKFGDNNTRVWVCDLGDDYCIIDFKGTYYTISYMRDNDNIMIGDSLQEVKKKTTWERVTEAVKSVLTSSFSDSTTNQRKEGNNMFREHIQSVLQANSIDYSAMSDQEQIAKYDSIVANAANDNTGEQASQPEISPVGPMAGYSEMIANEVAKALAKAKAEEEKDEKSALAEKLKANGVELSESEVDAMSVNSLNSMIQAQSRPAFGLAGPANMQANSALENTLPE